MNRRTKWAALAVVTATAAVVGGAGIAYAAGGDDTETRITGDDLRRATSAALGYTGQGWVSGTEVGDEESYYEVEVTLDDGSQVDVQLDRRFQVVTSAADIEGDGS